MVDSGVRGPRRVRAHDHRKESARTCDEEDEEGEEQEVSDVEHRTRDGVQREVQRPVHNAVREHPEGATAPNEERAPVPSVRGWTSTSVWLGQVAAGRERATGWL